MIKIVIRKIPNFYDKEKNKIYVSLFDKKIVIKNLFELSDRFIKNENSVLPIFIEKNFVKKLLLSVENEVCFLKKENPIFPIKFWQIIFSTSCKKFKIFPFVLFEKRRLAQVIRRPKAVDSPLHLPNIIAIAWLFL